MCHLGFYLIFLSDLFRYSEVMSVRFTDYQLFLCAGSHTQATLHSPHKSVFSVRVLNKGVCSLTSFLEATFD